MIIREYPFEVKYIGNLISIIPLYIGFQDTNIEFEFLTWSRKNVVPIELQEIMWQKIQRQLGYMVYLIDNLEFPVSHRVQDTHVDYIYNY